MVRAERKERGKHRNFLGLCCWGLSRASSTITLTADVVTSAPNAVWCFTQPRKNSPQHETLFPARAPPHTGRVHFLCARRGESAAERPLHRRRRFRAELATTDRPLTRRLGPPRERSLQFDRACAQQSVCNPSRSSFLRARPDTLRIGATAFIFANSTRCDHLRCGSRSTATDALRGKILPQLAHEVHGDPRS